MPKIMVLPKSLKVKLYKYSQWSCKSVNASLLFDHLAQRRSGRGLPPGAFVGSCVKEGCYLWVCDWNLSQFLRNYQG